MENGNYVEECLVGKPYSNIAVSPENKLFVATRGSDLEFLAETKTTIEKRRILEHDSEIVGVFFSSEQKLITVTKNGEISVFELSADSSEPPRKISSNRVTAFPVVLSFLNKPSDIESEPEIWLVVLKEGEKKKMFEIGYVTSDSSLEVVLEVPAVYNKHTMTIQKNVIAFCHKNKVEAILLNKGRTIEKRTVYEHRNTSKDIDSKLFKFVRIAVNGNFLAASTVFGSIYQWSNLETVGVSDKCHTFHWHKVAPSIALTKFGNVLSGGAECVFSRTIKGQKEPNLLPRLISPISDLCLSDDSSIVLLMLENSTFHCVLLSTMAISKSFSTLNYCPRSLNCLFELDPLGRRYFVTNAKPGSVQWIDPMIGKTSKTANLTLENVVDGDMSVVGIKPSYRDVLAISLNSKYFASLEKLVNFNDDNTLRFWKRVGYHDISGATLVSKVVVPQDCVFVALCNRESVNYEKTVITASTSGTISVWEYCQNDQDVREDLERRRNWQESEIDAITSIQPDGKFVTAHGKHAVLWNVKNMKVVDVLSCSDRITSLEFYDKNLIISTKKGVVCWDTLCLMVLWKIQQRVGIFVSNKSGCFAFDGPQVMQFDAETGKVLNSIKFSAPVERLLVNLVVNSLVYTAKTEKGILCYKPESIEQADVKIPAKITPFQALGQKLKESANGSAEIDQKFVRQPRPQSARLFGGPVHSLPPISFIAPIFVEKSLLPLPDKNC